MVKDLVLIGQHTSPKTAMKEMDELYTVFKEVYKTWQTDVGSNTTESKEKKNFFVWQPSADDPRSVRDPFIIPNISFFFYFYF